MPSASLSPTDPSQSTGSVYTTSPEPSFGRGLWFGWVVGWSMLWTALLSPFVVVNSAFTPTARSFVRWMRPWASMILGGGRIRQRVIQRGDLPDGPVVFVANHQSSLDIPATSAAIPRPFLYLARQDLRSWPIVGWVLERTACVFIDRDNPRRALESLKVASDRVRAGESVLLFPEGGRSYRHGLREFLRGSFVLAIQAGVPVVPVVLVGHPGVVNEKVKAARPGEIVCVLCEPIPTEGMKRREAGVLCDQVRAVMEAEMAQFG